MLVSIDCTNCRNAFVTSLAATLRIYVRQLVTLLQELEPTEQRVLHRDTQSSTLPSTHTEHEREQPSAAKVCALVFQGLSQLFALCDPKLADGFSGGGLLRQFFDPLDAFLGIDHNFSLPTAWLAKTFSISVCFILLLSLWFLNIFSCSSSRL